MKLTAPQREVMEYLRGGHHAHRAYCSAVHINGKRVCTVATMLALEKRGLAKRLNNDEWSLAEDRKGVVERVR